MDGWFLVCTSTRFKNQIWSSRIIVLYWRLFAKNCNINFPNNSIHVLLLLFLLISDFDTVIKGNGKTGCLVSKSKENFNCNIIVAYCHVFG